MKVLLNADDLGLTKGFNEAIKAAHLEGYLTHASLMGNTDDFEDAVVNVLPFCPNLTIGLHVNLTSHHALSPSTTTIAHGGIFHSSFVKLLFLFKSKKVKQEIEAEIELQIQQLLKKGIFISHIDGHNHVHIIPSINTIVRKLARKYKIPRVRELNEGFFHSLKYNWRRTTVANIVKYSLLRFLALFNENSNATQFYSILTTCDVHADSLFPYLEDSKHIQEIEVMVHPCILALNPILKGSYNNYLNSPKREQEFELCFNKKFEDYR